MSDQLPSPRSELRDALGADAEADLTALVGNLDGLSASDVDALKTLFLPLSADDIASAPAPDTLDAKAENAAAIARNWISYQARNDLPADEPVSTPVSPLRQAYRRSAAVLSTCDPATLRPMRTDPDTIVLAGQAYTELLDDLVPAYAVGDSTGQWMLRPDLRLEALAELGDRPALIAALDANPDRPDDPLQRALEAQIRGTATPIDEQSPDDLQCALQVVRWLQGTRLTDLPDPERIKALIAEKRLLATFEEMVEDFVGRTGELARLRDHVGVLPVTGASLKGLRSQFRRWRHQSTAPPMVYYAAGGVGKSTLIAKFLLDHHRVPAELRFPWTYLDFDNPALIAAQPITLLHESASQLAVQYPAARQQIDAYLGSVHERSAATLPTAQMAPQANTQTEFITQRMEEETERFGRLLHSIIGQSLPGNTEASAPFLIVVDTYEEVQGRGIEHELRLWNLLDLVQRWVPTLRVVVFGRGRLNRIPTSDVSLDPEQLLEFDAPTADALLKHLGITAASDRKQLWDEVGGNPLSLKLAAQDFLQTRAAGEAPGSYRIRRWKHIPLVAATESVVQGQLYQRILGHIRDKDVASLAHPGLVLRRITPALIKDVLQEPCGVDVPSDERAQELFEAFRAQVSLVTEEPDGALRHRPDVRQVMLKLIERDQPEKVEQINSLAVAYYEQHDEPFPVQARAEELYHRLQLGQNASVIDERWLDGVEDYLGRDVLNEIPAPSRRLLAARLGVRLDEQELTSASTEEWEQYVVRQVEEALKQNQYDVALRLMRDRRDRTPTSPLYLLEAKAQAGRGRYREAEKVLEAASRAAHRANSRNRLLDVTMFAADLAERRGDVIEADAFLADAGDLARRMSDLPRQIEIANRRLLLRERPNAPFTDTKEQRARSPCS
jgi:hypothetical protein